MQFLGNVKLLITKEDSELVPFHIEEKHFDGKKEASYEDDLHLLETEYIPLPEEFEALEVGKSLWLIGEFWGEYTQDYWGEWGCELEFRDFQVVELR